MTYTPKLNKRGAFAASGAALVCGAAAFLLAPVSGALPLMQLAGIALFSICIFILNRYALQYYIYSVENQGGKDELTVYKVAGKRSSAVCRIYLSDCAALERKTDRKPEFDKAITAKYRYTVNIFPKEEYLLFFRDGESVYQLALECDSAFADFLAHGIPSDADLSVH